MSSDEMNDLFACYPNPDSTRYSAHSIRVQPGTLHRHPDPSEPCQNHLPQDSTVSAGWPPNDSDRIDWGLSLLGPIPHFSSPIPAAEGLLLGITDTDCTLSLPDFPLPPSSLVLYPQQIQQNMMGSGEGLPLPDLPCPPSSLVLYPQQLQQNMMGAGEGMSLPVYSPLSPDQILSADAILMENKYPVAYHKEFCDNCGLPSVSIHHSLDSVDTFASSYDSYELAPSSSASTWSSSTSNALGSTMDLRSEPHSWLEEPGRQVMEPDLVPQTPADNTSRYLNRGLPKCIQNNLVADE
ncbi:hypothetical protein GQ53DRAFT_845303 [Thozetella sp. PMI_491]|nr:hypothetical protein GQ53DRAFT_845303 [Thozetella sp. PMI_491]